jgi:hypothetical protein
MHCYHFCSDSTSPPDSSVISDHLKQSEFSMSSASTALPSAQVIHLRIPNVKISSTRIVFTKANIKKLRCPSGKQEAFFWDASCGGFGMRVLSSERRSWIFQYRDAHKRTRRIALGDVSAVSLDAARQAARKHAASVVQGGNPSVARQKQRNAPTVLTLIEEYLPYAEARQRRRTYEETKRHLKHHAAPLHHDRAEGLQRREIAALLERVKDKSGPIAANRLRAALSALWSWGLRTGHIDGDSNPVSLTVRNIEKPRERTLSDQELEAIWQATEADGDYSRIVRLCLLTGCRREEIGGLRWDEIQEDWIIIGADRMKRGRVHEVALLPLILAALPSKTEDTDGHVFGRRKDWILRLE